MLASFLFSLITVLISFCGIAYQFLISRVLIQFSQDEVLNQSITLGVYLLALGVGAALASRLSSVKNRQNLYLIEIAVSSLGILLVPLIYLFQMIKNIFFSNVSLGLFYGDKVVFQMQIFTFLIGLLTGFELPMLMQLGQGRQTLRFSNSRVLALSYFGALLGALFSAGLIFPKIDRRAHV